MDTGAVVRLFESWLREQGLAERSARAYASDLHDYLAAVGGPGPQALSSRLIRRWLDSLVEEGYAPATIRRRLTSIRRFCQLLVEAGILPCDPTEAVSVSIPDPEPVQCPREDVEAVLVPDLRSDIGIRDRAIMVLLVDTGMQLQELCALDRRVRREHMKSQTLVGAILCLGLILTGCRGGGTDDGGGTTPPPPAPEPETVVQGHVKDAIDPGGVAGASVTVGGRSDTTNANGYYRVTNVPTGSRHVSVAPPNGYALAAPVSSQQIGSGTTTIPDTYVVPDSLEPPASPL
jgi:hypothetical protein